MLSPLGSALLAALAPQSASGGEWLELRTLVGKSPEMLGECIAGAGDLDADGVPDFVVGATWMNNGGIATPGGAYAYSGATGAQIWRFLASGSFWAGHAVIGVDDWNGDGVREIAVGAPYARAGLTANGSVFLVDGRSGGLLRQIDGATDRQNHGYSLASLGDLDGDGKGELLVGAPGWSGGAGGGGGGFVYGSATGAVLRQVAGQRALAYVGRSAAGLDDVDGDGVPDFALGSEKSGAPSGSIDAGVVNLFSGATGNRIRTLYGNQSEKFGAALALCPDVDGDGVGELLIGALGYGVQALYGRGAAYLVSPPTGTVLWVVEGEGYEDQLGYALSYAGDVDGDGDGDVIVGAWLTDFFGSNSGSAYLYDLTTGARIHRLDGRPAVSGPLWFGSAVAGAGDLNGDGTAEVLVGVPDAGGLALEGNVHVFGMDPYLHASSTELSASSGVPLDLGLAFPLSEAGAPYAILASASGTGPSTVTGGLQVPLASDALFLATISGTPLPQIVDGYGALNTVARARAGLRAGNGLGGHVGHTFHVAAVTYSNVGSVHGRLSSVARPVTIVP